MKGRWRKVPPERMPTRTKPLHSAAVWKVSAIGGTRHQETLKLKAVEWARRPRLLTAVKC